MSLEVTLKPMTAEMYHEFFKEYENDRDLYLDENDYFDYIYEEANMKRQRSMPIFKGR